MDISHNNNQESLNLALETLAYDENETLRVLTLKGSSPSFDQIKKILSKCPNLYSLDLQSCRTLPRGTKRVFNREDLLKFKTDVMNGRYDDFE